MPHSGIDGSHSETDRDKKEPGYPGIKYLSN